MKSINLFILLSTFLVATGAKAISCKITVTEVKFSNFATYTGNTTRVNRAELEPFKSILKSKGYQPVFLASGATKGLRLDPFVDCTTNNFGAVSCNVKVDLTHKNELIDQQISHASGFSSMISFTVPYDFSGNLKNLPDCKDL